MSICVALAVPDGIALAADTQTTWHKTITTVKAKDGSQVDLAEPLQMPIGWSRMARKLFPLKFGDQQYAFCTAGAASINQKTIYSILKSAEATYKGDGECSNVLDHCKNHIWKELRGHFKADDLPKSPIRMIELIVATFGHKDVSRPILETHSLYSGTPMINGKPDPSGHVQSWKNADSGVFSCCWVGRTEFVSHIVNHSNKDLPPIQGQYHMMTLADAKDYARFLVEYTCDFQRFAIMVPDCGRPVVVASLTPESYEEKVI